MSTNKHKIAVIAGDGIGNEVVPPTCRILEAVARKHDLGFTFDEKDWSCERYHKNGAMMPEDGLDEIRNHDSILLGAVGYPGVPDHVSLWGLLIPIRREFQQYVSLRPVRLFEGMPCPLVGRKPATSTWSWCVKTTKANILKSVGAFIVARPTRWFRNKRSLPARAPTELCAMHLVWRRPVPASI